jgi:hypothetical protein
MFLLLLFIESDFPVFYFNFRRFTPLRRACDNERLGYDSPSHFSRFSAFCNSKPVCFSPTNLTAQADAEQWPAHFSHILDGSTPLFNHFPSIYSV